MEKNNNTTLYYPPPSHSALKLEKKCNFKSTKTHYLHFQKWQKINFCTRKKSENCIFVSFKLFSGAKNEFLCFWNCTFFYISTVPPPKNNKNWDIYTNLHFYYIVCNKKEACKIKRRRNARAFDQFCPHMPGPLSTF